MIYRKVCIGIMLGIVSSVGCMGLDSVKPDNVFEIETEEINKIIISYDMENIDFYWSNNKNLIIKEYMTNNKKRYYANVDNHFNTIKISEGKRPVFDKYFKCRVEVFLPKQENLDLVVTTTGGNICINEVNWKGKAFYADSTFGTIEIDSISADSIKLSTTNGKILCNNLNAGELNFENIGSKSISIDNTSGQVYCKNIFGRIRYASTNGQITVENAYGYGVFVAGSSGEIALKYREISGDIDIQSKNKDIKLTIPSDFSFKYNLRSKNGIIKAFFLDGRSNAVAGELGENPEYKLTIETNNGDIEINR